MRFVVAGASKSGTTWLQKALDAHPEVRCLFQVPIMPLDLWANGLRHELPVVHRGTESAFGGVFEDDDDLRRARLAERYLRSARVTTGGFLDPVLADVDDDHLRDELHGLHRDVVAAVADTVLTRGTDKPIVGTKATTDVALFLDAFPEARVVHVVRDGRDVCVSRRFHDLRARQHYVGDERSRVLAAVDRTRLGRRLVGVAQHRLGVFGAGSFERRDGDALFTPALLEKYARDWDGTVRYYERHAVAAPDRVLTVRYEELLADTGATLGRILRFLGADDAPAVVDGLVSATRFDRLRQAGGNGEAEQSFFRSGTAGDWQRHFRPGDDAVFADAAGALLIELGYEPSANWVRG